MTTEILRIVDWDEHFENSRTRNMKVMQWVPIPNKHDGDGYTELIGQKDGPLLYACWITILQVASRCHPRGTLVRGTNTPHTAETLARMTRIPEKVYEKAIPVLLDIGWLERISIDDNGLRQALQDPDRTLIGDHQEGVPHGTGARLEGREGIEGKGTEGKEGNELVTVSTDRVIAHYQTYHPKAKPGADDRKRIQARLKEDFSADDLIAAIDGNHRDPHCCGNNPESNPTGTKYHNLELITRNAGKVQQYMEVPDGGTNPHSERGRVRGCDDYTHLD